MTSIETADTVRLLFNPLGRNGPHYRVEGWPAVLVMVAIVAGLATLIWRFFYYRKRARSVAARADMQSKALFESSPVGMFLYDTRTQKILRGNPAFSETIGYAPEEITKLTLADIFPEDVVEEARRVYGSGKLMPAQVQPIITKVRRRDGTEIAVDARGRPMDPEHGHSRLVLCMDVTEQVEGERALREAEQRARSTSELIRSIVDVAPQAIVAVDLVANVTLWNRAAESLFGWKSNEVLGKPLPIVTAEERITLTVNFQRLLSTGFNGPRDTVRLHKDGSVIPLVAAAGIRHDETGNAAGVVMVYTDMRQNRALEAQLRQSQKMEAVGRLAGGVAHDFNNMLTVITAYVQILKEEHPDDALAEPLGEIQAAATRAAALTRQLLTFSRMQVVTVQQVDVTELVEKLEPMLRRLSPANIELKASLTRDIGQVQVDPAQLEQVLVNLAMNAMDAMPDGGTLRVETHNVELDAVFARAHQEVVPGPYVMIAVTDTGSGMDAATLSKIFEPFFTTKPAGQGTGLGLAIAYSVVKQAHGHIWVYSERGQGTTFKIYLPRSDSSTPRPTPSSRLAAVPRGGTVLLVEDDVAVRRSVHATLLRLGYSVIEADSGEVALTLLREHQAPINAVLTDLMMPGMSGRELSEHVARVRPGVRVLFMSGYTDDEVLRRQLVDAGQHFLQKPFTTEQLVAAIEAR